MTKAGIVVVFDFDKTIIDVDSDNWVVDELGFTERFNELVSSMPWNSAIDTMMKELHAHGTTSQQISDALKRVPCHPSTVSAIKAAHALGCELRVVSDANMFFIETILEHLGLRGCFSEINSNPGYVDEEGRVRILPYHDFNKCSHGCALCPPNMCKGLIIERIQAELGEKMKTMIYLGDGAGDYCPSLRLSVTDFVLPRTNFPMWDLIRKDPSVVKAEIRGWADGEEQHVILLHVIDSILFDDVAGSTVLPLECEFQISPVNGALSKAVRV